MEYEKFQEKFSQNDVSSTLIDVTQFLLFFSCSFSFFLSCLFYHSLTFFPKFVIFAIKFLKIFDYELKTEYTILQKLVVNERLLLSLLQVLS